MYFRVALSILMALIFSVFVMWFQRSTLLCEETWGCSISWASSNTQTIYNSYRPTVCMPDSSWKVYKCLGPHQCCKECQNYRITNNTVNNNNNKLKNYITIEFQTSRSGHIYSKVCFGSCVLICIFVSVFYVGISYITRYKEKLEQKCISQTGFVQPNSFQKKLSVLMFFLCLTFLLLYIALFWWGVLKLWKSHQSFKHCQIELFHVITWIITCLVITIFLITIILKSKYCLKFIFSLFFTLHILWSIFLIIYLEGVYNERWFIHLL